MLLKHLFPTVRTPLLPAPVLLLLTAGLLLTLGLLSCEKVIELDLDGVEAKYVIEGTLSNQAGNCRVLISATRDFDEDNEFPGISGATVEISREGAGPENLVRLLETAPGVYQADDFAGVSGTTYKLRVSIGEETFTASSTMPQQVALDTLYITEETIFGESWKLANVRIADPAGASNYYHYTQYINGQKGEEPFIADDELVNGRETEIKLYMNPGTDDEDRIRSGDSLKIEMRCIDAPMYTYWFSLEQGATGNGSPFTPANPVSNLQGGALGYFSAHTLQSKTIRVP